MIVGWMRCSSATASNISRCLSYRQVDCFSVIDLEHALRSGRPPSRCISARGATHRFSRTLLMIAPATLEDSRQRSLS